MTQPRSAVDLVVAGAAYTEKESDTAAKIRMSPVCRTVLALAYLTGVGLVNQYVKSSGELITD